MFRPPAKQVDCKEAAVNIISHDQAKKVFLIMDNDQNQIGVLRYALGRSFIQLATIDVDPQHRKKKHGSLLMEKFLEYAVEQKLDVQIFGLNDAKEFYEKFFKKHNLNISDFDSDELSAGVKLYTIKQAILTNAFGKPSKKGFGP